MKLCLQCKLKRQALGMTQKEFAATVAKIDEGIYSVFEEGKIINKVDYVQIKENVYYYIKHVLGGNHKNREAYLIFSIVYEALCLTVEDPSEHAKTLFELGVHKDKLGLMYYGTKKEEDYDR